MKKIIAIVFLQFALIAANAQDMSKVYRLVEEVTLKDGISQEEYENFEAFWKTVKDMHIKEGKLMGWFLWKMDPSSNDGNPWADYLIVNVFANKAQMDEMMSKPEQWWVKDVQVAHKGKTKRSIVKKYTKETLENKYRAKSVTYTNKGLAAYLKEGLAPEVGTKGDYIGIEQLNDDYVGFETNHFAPWHKKSDTRLYWELNEIVDRTENAYQPVTHMIFEILNPEKSYDGMTFSFTDQMMSKYGQASRKMHGAMTGELVHFSW